MFPIADPVLLFTVLAALILLAPLLAERLRIPDLVLLLAAGALLGPNGVGLLERDESVTLFGSVGLLYIMFLAGLEIDLHRFMSSRYRSISFGLLTFAIPQGLGTLAGRFVLGMDWPAAILLASMFASHTLLSYPIASRLGISRTEPVTIAVGATIITDTLALLVLAIIADSAKGIALNFEFWTVIVVGSAVLFFVIWWGIPLISRWFFQTFTEKGSAQFLFVIVTVCGCAYLSHYARLEPIIGAFLAGAAFNRMIPEHSPLMNRLEFMGNTLFIPFFLISVGMLVDPGVLINDPRSWVVATTMVVAVIITKYAAAWISQVAFGYSQPARNVMFGLSVVQAAATLAAVVVGYNLKIFNESVLNGAIAMILVTCPLGAWVVDKYGRQLADGECTPSKSSSAVEQRLLVPVANPDSGRHLLDLSFLLRNSAIPGGIFPLTIVQDQGSEEASVMQGERLLASCMAHASSADIPVNPGLRMAVNVSDGIMHAAKEIRASTVIAGWSGVLSAGARLLGTIMYNLMESCPSRLIFCRLTQPINTTRRLLAVFPPLAARRLDIAETIPEMKRLAHQIGADLHIYLAGHESEALQSKIEKAHPTCSLTFLYFETWAEARTQLFDDILPDDLTLLLLERRGGILWTPSLNRLPDLMAMRFPEMSLLVAYPPLPSAWEEHALEIILSDDFAPVLFLSDLPAGISLEAGLREMLNRAVPGDQELARAAIPLLMTSAASFPVELAPGTVLLHAHCGDMEPTLLFIGYTPNGWSFANLPTPVRFVMVLISPRSQPPEMHLKTLAHLARRFHDPTIADKVKRASSSSELGALLQ